MRYDDLPPIGKVDLPPLPYKRSPNQSSRGGRRVRLVFVHVWGGGSFASTTAWLRDPTSEASAHVVYGNGEAVQLVPFAAKAWTECDLNAVGISVESADAIWQGRDPHGFAQLARIVAGLCHFHLEPTQARYVDAHGITCGSQGFTFHRTAGALGCGHTHCPSDDEELLMQFRNRVYGESRHRDFRKAWGR